MIRTRPLVVIVAAAALLTGCGSLGASNPPATVVATGGTGSAPGTPTVAAPTTSAASVAPKVGDTVRVTDGDNVYDITVTPPAQAQPGEFATVNGTLYATTVTVKVATGTFDSNPLYFSAKSADGTTYDAALGATDDQLTTETTPAGQAVKGTVGFDIPAGGAIDLVIFSDALGSQLATWSTA